MALHSSTPAAIGLALLMAASDAWSAHRIEDVLTPSSDPTLFSAKDVDHVRKGGIAVVPVKHTAERELAAALACLLTEDAADALDQFRRVTPILATDHLRAHAVIDPDDPQAGLSALELGSGEEDELSRILSWEPGYGLNFSAAEIARIRALRQADTPGLEGVRELIVEVLVERLQAYREGGLDGIEPFAREFGAVSDAAAEMRADLEALTHLIPSLTRLKEAWIGYPDRQPESASHAFFWLVMELDDRPAVVLSHRLHVKVDDVEAVAIRNFFVSRFFDGAQMVAYLVPVEEGTLLVHSSRFWVDYWSGSGSLKHMVGTRMIARQIKHMVEERRICGRHP